MIRRLADQELSTRNKRSSAQFSKYEHIKQDVSEDSDEFTMICFQLYVYSTRGGGGSNWVTIIGCVRLGSNDARNQGGDE